MDHKNQYSRSAFLPWFCVILLSLLVAWPLAAEDRPTDASNTDAGELRQRAVDVLRRVVKDQDRWVKVHAAEELLALDYPQGIKDAFLAEEKRYGEEPEYRIGVWRVLARASSSEKERTEWIVKIRAPIDDAAAPDRCHAIETFAKLNDPATEEEMAALREIIQNGPELIRPYAAWVLMNSGQADAESSLVEMLDSPDAKTRGGAAYALFHQGTLRPATINALIAKAKAEPKDSEARVYLLSAAVIHGPSDVRTAFTGDLKKYMAEGQPADRYQAAMAFSQIGGKADLPWLTGYFDDPDPDVAAAAAYATMRVERRNPHPLSLIDWSVIAAYGAFLIGVGWYYQRRTKTREQYYLGDRNMSPIMVGLSLFAALLSTISFLALPGEIIKYGPVFLSYLLIYPLCAIVIGGWMIPFIMRLRVTSAYEILEVRLGPACRTIGSVLFLLLRLFWMAVIIYATTAKVLVPLLGLEAWTTPIVGTAMAAFAITYTTMGGLKAAVLTGVVKTGVLLGAAVLMVILITHVLGGTHAWWPSHWPAHWPAVKFYDPTERMTMFGTMLATFTWFVCTSVSDQIAVQRYLATRDVKAARTVLYITLGADTVIAVVLVCVGLGLLAYFQAYPNLLSDGQTVLGDSDKLFARYIVVGLPTGLSGLVVAALLACAIASLAAGINSAASVVTVDFIDRIRRQDATAEARHVGQLQWISFFVGVAVVVLSLVVYLVPGNLMEVCYKVVNLLTAPLGGLFLLAMFVPWARGFGVIVGVVCGLATAILVSYWHEITGTTSVSWIWAMPLSLVVEFVVGALVSLIPIGPRRPMLT